MDANTGLIEVLKTLEKTELLGMLDDPTIWKSVDIDYHPPRVKRLWASWGKYRVNLHVIFPCTAEEALFHPHPWSSAVHILNGRYEMVMGYSPGPETEENVPKLATIEFQGAAYYDMPHKDAWHSVRPIGKCCYTIILTGPKWDRPSPKADYKLKELDEEKIEVLLQHFKGLITQHLEMEEKMKGWYGLK